MNWLNLTILVLVFVGHTELVVTLSNRMHAIRIGCRGLRHLQQVHDGLIIFFPLALIWFVGIRGPGLLTGGSWSHLSIAWKVYFGCCFLGVGGVIISAVRWGLKSPPPVQISNHSWTVDVSKRLGYRPIGEGPFQFLTKIPGNEIFRVEVSEKSYKLPRLPDEWDGLSILHLSDYHIIGTIDRPFFEQITELSKELQPDLIVFTGDLIDDPCLLDWLPKTLGQLQARLGCFFILGNHDWYVGHESIRAVLSALGWQDVAGEVVSIDHNGRQLVIAGTEVPWMGHHPDFSKIADDSFRILLSHTPDHIPWARQNGVDLMLSGHNHGGQVVLPVIGPVYSPSRYGTRFSSGVFQLDPTLLYVSRGISARHPLRWNCPPELTKLVLKSCE